MAIIQNAYQALRQNTRRSILTMIGIIIGISSVITILSLGRGFESYTVKNLTVSDENNVTVDVSFYPTDYEQFDSGKMRYFSDEDLTFAAQVAGVEAVKYVNEDDNYESITFQVRDTKYNKSLGFVSFDDEKVSLGRKISREENDSHQKVALISRDTAEDLNPTVEKVLGTGIEIEGEFYQIVGIFENDSANLFSMVPDIKIPKKSYRYYTNDGDNPMQIRLSVAGDFKPSAVANKVIKKLTKVGSSRNFGEYMTFDMSELTDGIGKVLKTLTYFISGVAGISLFIAGVGVMNMMYTSVSERTQEIGVRRSVGAKRSDIRNQFLAEGLMLTISSGVIGYIIGYLIALVISTTLPFKVAPDLFTISLTLVITIVIGLVFSITPANMAARKDLVEILR
ncbi:ABC transporter permease [Lactococcus hodotermopsidis]|uniref:ABC transporter permease n=1 Tax=Pseudolactococcus hodotermopsidis TaxID=2709157 RepID=UPI001E57A69D|nr:ABC transporter permease [Lactococcus hodotermopsidis]